MILARLNYMDTYYWCLAKKQDGVYKGILFNKISLRVPVKGEVEDIKILTTLGELIPTAIYSFTKAFEIKVLIQEGRKEAILCEKES